MNDDNEVNIENDLKNELVKVIKVYTPSWGVIALRGVLALLFGVIAIAWPGIVGQFLIVFIGVYLFIDGIFLIIASISAHSRIKQWIEILLEGILCFLCGIFFFVFPAAAGEVFIMIISFWAVITGILEISLAVKIKNLIKEFWLLLLGGIFSVILGMLLWFQPLAGMIAVVTLIGIYAVFFGFVIFSFAFIIKNWKTHTIK